MTVGPEPTSAEPPRGPRLPDTPAAACPRAPRPAAIRFPRTATAAGCHSGRQCRQAACLRVQLEAPGGPQPIRISADTCGGHLGDTVHDLTVWAHGHHLARADLTVLAIGRPPALPHPARAAEPPGGALAFTTIRLGDLR